MALEARAGAEGHDRHPRLVRECEDGRYLMHRLGEDDDVGPVRLVVREVGRVLVEHRVAVADASFVGDQSQQVGLQAGGDAHVCTLARLRSGP